MNALECKIKEMNEKDRITELFNKRGGIDRILTEIMHEVIQLITKGCINKYLYIINRGNTNSWRILIMDEYRKYFESTVCVPAQVTFDTHIYKDELIIVNQYCYNIYRSSISTHISITKIKMSDIFITKKFLFFFKYKTINMNYILHRMISDNRNEIFYFIDKVNEMWNYFMEKKVIK